MRNGRKNDEEKEIMSQSQIIEATQYYLDNNQLAACYLQRKYKVTRSEADKVRNMIITQTMPNRTT